MYGCLWLIYDLKEYGKSVDECLQIMQTDITVGDSMNKTWHFFKI